MKPSTRASWLFAAVSFALAGCGDDSASQVPPRPVATQAAPTPEATANPTPPPTIPTTPNQGIAIGALMPAPDLVRAMLAIVQASDRTGISATSADGVSYQIVLAPDVDASRATALARALGNLSTMPLAWPPSAPLFSIEVLTVRSGTTLNQAPGTNSPIVANLPDGATFVGFVGTTPAGPSAREGEGAWLYGYDSSGRVGWVRGASLAVEEGCLLSNDVLAGALSLRLDDPALLTALRGNIHLVRGGQSKRGTYFITDTYLALLERPSNCRSATLDSRIDLDAPVEELHYGLTAEHGDTFLAIATMAQDDSDQSTWGFYPPRATEPALSVVLATNWNLPSRSKARVRFGLRRGPGNARGFWPFSIQRPGEAEATFYTSDGTTFAEATAAPAPAPATP